MMEEQLKQELYELQQEMEISENRLNEAIGLDNPTQEIEKEADSIYKAYWNLIYGSISEKYRMAVQNNIGTGHFTEKVYVDMLVKAMEDDGKIVFEYQGYELRKGYDQFGYLTYWIYDMSNNQQVQESFDFSDDDGAINIFKTMVDQNDFDW